MTVTQTKVQPVAQQNDYSDAPGGHLWVRVYGHATNPGGQNAEIVENLFLIGSLGIEYSGENETGEDYLPATLAPGQSSDGLLGSFFVLKADSALTAILVIGTTALLYKIS